MLRPPFCLWVAGRSSVLRLLLSERIVARSEDGTYSRIYFSPSFLSVLSFFSLSGIVRNASDFEVGASLLEALIRALSRWVLSVCLALEKMRQGRPSRIPSQRFLPPQLIQPLELILLCSLSALVFQPTL